MTPSEKMQEIEASRQRLFKKQTSKLSRRMINGSRNPTIQQFAVMVQKYNLDSDFFIKPQSARKAVIFKQNNDMKTTTTIPPSDRYILVVSDLKKEPIILPSKANKNE